MSFFYLHTTQNTKLGMAKPYAILFQKMVDGAKVIDTQKEWGIVCKDFPFKVFGDAKDLPSRSWPDKNGDDEFIPATIPVKSYEIDVEFAYKGDMNTANEKLILFFEYITGKNGDGSSLRVYDTYTKIGKQKVRYVSCSEDLFVRNTDEGDVVTFTVRFKVNDPVDNIVLLWVNG
jgi:hypothetical protein|nr:MAG TPA: hypothetical protein [Caudoviricetes sp.]